MSEKSTAAIALKELNGCLDEFGDQLGMCPWVRKHKEVLRCALANFAAEEDAMESEKRLDRIPVSEQS